MDMHELVTLRAAYTRAQKDALALFRAEFSRLIQQPECWGPLRVQRDARGKVNAHRTLYGAVRMLAPSEPFCSLLTYGFTVQSRLRDAHGGLYNVSSEHGPKGTTLLVWPCTATGAEPEGETPLDWSELRRHAAREELRELRESLAERREEIQRLRAEYRRQVEYARSLRELARVGKPTRA